MKHIVAVLYVLVASSVVAIQAASADSCPIRLAYVSQIGLGAQHGTAEYELDFGSGEGHDNGPFTVNLTADLSDGTQIHFNVDGVSKGTYDLNGRPGQVILFPFATEVRSFRIDNASDSRGLSPCADNPAYPVDNGPASQGIRFDDGPTSSWPVKSPAAVDIVNARILSLVPLDVSAFAMDQGAQGEVRVLVVILSDGSVGKESVDQSSGYGLLDQAALIATKKSTFKPAHLSAALGGDAIASAYVIIYQFWLH